MFHPDSSYVSLRSHTSQCRQRSVGYEYDGYKYDRGLVGILETAIRKHHKENGGNLEF